MTSSGSGDAAEPVKIVRVISRLNVGGPAIQAITLTQRLSERGYTTILVRGREEPEEGTMDHLAAELGVRPVLVPSLRRNPGFHDLRALRALIRLIRSERPQIVHTHAAKGGTLGRAAALLASVGRRRPKLIHTYHGHSLTGYFSPRSAAVYRVIERILAHFTDCLIAISPEVRDELVALHVAPGSKFVVVPLGFELAAFARPEPERQAERAAVRAELEIPQDARVVVLVARLTAIKRVDRFLRIARRLADVEGVRFLIVGDGELRASLQSSADAIALGDRAVWTGFRQDMPRVLFAGDVVVQTSDNEGTPVSLIEAQAAGVPVVSTRVGGVPSVVQDPQLLSEAGDEAGLAATIRSLLDEPEIAERRAASARPVVLERFALDRLVDDIDGLYRSLLSSRARES